MDPFTHAFSGWAISHLIRRKTGSEQDSKGSGFRDRLIAPFCMICAMAPDIDILVSYLGVEETLLYRRALTHSVVGLPLLAAALFLLGRRILPDMKSIRVYLLALSLCALHVFMDLVNSYGTQVLYPLSNHRFAWDLIFIVDPFWTMSLLIAGVLGSIPGQPRQSIGRIGLGLCLIYPLVCLGAREGMYQKLVKDKPSVEQVTLLPDAFSPWYWKIIEEKPTEFTLSGRSFGGVQVPQVSFTRVSEDKQKQFKESIPFLKTYFWFNRFPAFQEKSDSQLRLLDLRFVSLHPWLTVGRGGDGAPFSLDLFFESKGYNNLIYAIFGQEKFSRAKENR